MTRPNGDLSHISHRISLDLRDVFALGNPFLAPDAKVADHAVCEVEEVGVLTRHFVPETLEPRSVTPKLRSQPMPDLMEGVRSS